MAQFWEQLLPAPASYAGARALSRATIPSAGFLDTLSIFADVLLPTLSKGVIIRRPRVLAVAEFLDLDRRAVTRMQRVRNRYGAEPLMLAIPGRRIALVFEPDDVHRILEHSPDPFATDTKEKRATLAHFEPKGVLISSAQERPERRRYNEQALDAPSPVHAMAPELLTTLRTEAEHIHQHVRRTGELTWSAFSDAWFRMVRRIIFGNIAAHDNRLSEIMATLRFRSNWAFLRPTSTELRQRLLDRIAHYLAIADPNSLAGMMSRYHATAATAPEHQVPQWLFAFDVAGMAAFRGLALLATHPQQAHDAREEIRNGGTRPEMPFLRRVVLESVRLWPTTPLLLRETTVDTQWRNGIIPANTLLVIFTPFFHRDDQRLPWANAFVPDIWSEPEQVRRAPLIPFSEGPAFCPATNLVQMLGSAMLSELLQLGRPTLRHPSSRLRPDRPLPGTLNHYSLRFRFT